MPDRRGFFKELLREAAGVAHELSSAMQEATEPEPWRPPPPVPARPASARVDDEGPLALCHETGLEQRAADVRRMVQISLRLTLGGQGRSRLGGSPDLPPGISWPSWQGRELGFLGQVDLADVAVYYESRADHENEARAWRLLLQLSADELLGTPTDGSFERLYVCARERDLRAARFDDAWAICR